MPRNYIRNMYSTYGGKYATYGGKSYLVRQNAQGQSVIWTGYNANDHAKTLAIARGEKPYPTLTYLGKKQRVYVHRPHQKAWYTFIDDARSEYLPDGGSYFHSHYTASDHERYQRGEFFFDENGVGWVQG